MGRGGTYPASSSWRGAESLARAVPLAWVARRGRGLLRRLRLGIDPAHGFRGSDRGLLGRDGVKDEELNLVNLDGFGHFLRGWGPKGRIGRAHCWVCLDGLQFQLDADTSFRKALLRSSCETQKGTREILHLFPLSLTGVGISGLVKRLGLGPPEGRLHKQWKPRELLIRKRRQVGHHEGVRRSRGAEGWISSESQSPGLHSSLS